MGVNPNTMDGINNNVNGNGAPAVSPTNANANLPFQRSDFTNHGSVTNNHYNNTSI